MLSDFDIDGIDAFFDAGDAVKNILLELIVLGKDGFLLLNN